MTHFFKPHFSLLKLALGAVSLSLALAAQATPSVPLHSSHALVIDEANGEVLLEKNANAVVPIASLTKLMTAMVILDAKLDMNELIQIETDDVDVIKHSSSRVPVGASLPRRDVLHLALMSSDNRAAASLARTYPGGNAAFEAAVRAKIQALGMTNTSIGEPTGLSPANTSTAYDLFKMAEAASHYPDIVEHSTNTGAHFDMKGRMVEYHNTNRLVGKDGWDILLSKTGYTKEAGRCIIMRVQSAGKKVVMVLLNASETAGRTMDAMNVKRFLNGEPAYVAEARHKGRQVAAKGKSARTRTVTARAGRDSVVKVRAVHTGKAKHQVVVS